MIIYQNKKEIKKTAKLSSGYSKKQVQALRVLKKISTPIISSQLLFNFTTLILYSELGSIFSKNLLF